MILKMSKEKYGWIKMAKGFFSILVSNSTMRTSFSSFLHNCTQYLSSGCKHGLSNPQEVTKKLFTSLPPKRIDGSVHVIPHLRYKIGR